MTVTIDALDVRLEDLERLVDRVEQGSVSAADVALLRAVVHTLAHVATLLATHGTTLAGLRHLLLAQTATSEKTQTVLARAGLTPDPAPAPPPDPAPRPPARPRAPGHGRHGAAAFTGAQQVVIPHATLKAGDACPGCRTGKVYGCPPPARLVRFHGHAPITAAVFALERLRCNLCGEVFTATAPPAVGPEKYDPTAASVIAVLKYGSGMPFSRLAGLQRRLGIPLPATTQWDIVREVATRIRPAFDELQRQAARGTVLYNDDTSVPVLALRRERSPDGRTGIFTSGIVSATEGRQIALYLTGRPHAGENLATVLAQRPPTLPPPIQMCDALARNLPKLPEPLATIVGHCLAP